MIVSMFLRCESPAGGSGPFACERCRGRHRKVEVQAVAYWGQCGGIMLGRGLDTLLPTVRAIKKRCPQRESSIIRHMVLDKMEGATAGCAGIPYCMLDSRSRPLLLTPYFIIQYYTILYAIPPRRSPSADHTDKVQYSTDSRHHHGQNIYTSNMPHPRPGHSSYAVVGRERRWYALQADHSFAASSSSSTLCSTLSSRESRTR